jgi:ribonucrease Y
MDYLWEALLVISGLAGGILLGLAGRRYWLERKVANIQEQAKNLLQESRKEAEAIKKEAILQAKDSLFQMKADFEKETKETRKELQILEKRLLQKDENLEKKSESLDKRENNIARREKILQEQESDLNDRAKALQGLIEEQKTKLESLSGISAQEAKEMLVRSIESEARHDAALLAKRIETETREIADKKARNIIALAIQRYAGEYVAEKTVSVVTLPNEEMKGRIIGREGRNIRAIEASTGVDVIIDDTPEAVILSGFGTSYF